MNSYHSEGFHLDYTPEEDVPGGSIRQIAGQAGIANCDLEAGEVGALCVVGTVRVDKGAVEFLDGVTVGYDTATEQAVAAGTGDFDIGKAVGDWAAGASQVIVLLNAEGTIDAVV